MQSFGEPSNVLSWIKRFQSDINKLIPHAVEVENGNAYYTTSQIKEIYSIKNGCPFDLEIMRGDTDCVFYNLKSATGEYMNSLLY